MNLIRFEEDSVCNEVTIEYLDHGRRATIELQNLSADEVIIAYCHARGRHDGLSLDWCPVCILMREEQAADIERMCGHNIAGRCLHPDKLTEQCKGMGTVNPDYCAIVASIARQAAGFIEKWSQK